ncbi:MAG: ribonuclease HII [bacterium]|nr:ribonuclease HII [bacterium]
MVRIPDFKEERRLILEGKALIAGVDEVGCGAWAGPVFAAAVILPFNSRLRLIRDSKTLSPSQRAGLDQQIKQRATAWALGLATAEEIAELNIRQAANLAMRRAIFALTIRPDAILSDAFRVSGISMPCVNIIKGDAKVKSIAAASIIAKVARDLFMKEMDDLYPVYGFGNHKGYGTKQHQQALKEHGPCRIHRATYAPIARLTLAARA